MSTPEAHVRIKPRVGAFIEQLVHDMAILEAIQAEAAAERALRLGAGLLIVTDDGPTISLDGTPIHEMRRKVYIVTDLVPAGEAFHAPAGAVAAALGIDA